MLHTVTEQSWASGSARSRTEAVSELRASLLERLTRRDARGAVADRLRLVPRREAINGHLGAAAPRPDQRDHPGLGSWYWGERCGAVVTMVYLSDLPSVTALIWVDSGELTWTMEVGR